MPQPECTGFIDTHADLGPISVRVPVWQQLSLWGGMGSGAHGCSELAQPEPSAAQTWREGRCPSYPPGDQSLWLRSGTPKQGLGDRELSGWGRVRNRRGRSDSGDGDSGTRGAAFGSVPGVRESAGDGGPGISGDCILSCPAVTPTDLPSPPHIRSFFCRTTSFSVQTFVSLPAPSSLLLSPPLST